MYWISFKKYSGGGGYFFKFRRIYHNGKWTPFIRVKKRYDSWFGFWHKESNYPLV